MSVQEMRNKYAVRSLVTKRSSLMSLAQPAIYFLQSILDTIAEGSPLTLATLHTMRNDMSVALTCLREAEAQHNTRAFSEGVTQPLRRARHVQSDAREIHHLPPTLWSASLHGRMPEERGGHCQSEPRAREHRQVLRLVGVGVPPWHQHVSWPSRRFRSKVPEDLSDREIHVHTDAYILTHVVRNFLSNSRKYCNSGYVELEFCGASADRLVMKVRDTGCGVPKEIRDKLFATEVVRFLLKSLVDLFRRLQETTGVRVSGCRRRRSFVVRRAEATPSLSERKRPPSRAMRSAVGSPNSSSLSKEASLLRTRNTTHSSSLLMTCYNSRLLLLVRRPTTRRRAASPRRRTSSLLSSTTVRSPSYPCTRTRQARLIDSA